MVVLQCMLDPVSTRNGFRSLYSVILSGTFLLICLIFRVLMELNAASLKIESWLGFFPGGNYNIFFHWLLWGRNLLRWPSQDRYETLSFEEKYLIGLLRCCSSVNYSMLFYPDLLFFRFSLAVRYINTPSLFLFDISTSVPFSYYDYIVYSVSAY